MIDFNLLRSEAARHPYDLLFATVSGAHLYGFPSADSDYDLRGIHVLTAEEALGFLPKRETIEQQTTRDGIELDLVTHDVLKFFAMLLKRNGYVLEQLYSPLVVQSGAAHEELKAIAKRCITRYHGYHYLGFAATQWKLFLKEEPPRVKPLLYVYRVLLTGIHLMRTGQIESNIITLNDDFRLPQIGELVSRKIHEAEQATLEDSEAALHQVEYEGLVSELESAMERSTLQEEPVCREELNDLLVRVRLKSRVSGP